VRVGRRVAGVLRVGLTGGIGSGKSTVATRFRELGAVVVDADLVAREVVAPGSPGLAAVVARFGEGVLDQHDPHRGLDRAALARIAFSDDRARVDLEAITHPLVAARSADLAGAAPPDAVVVHDVPLLVEKSMGSAYHLVLVVGAAERTRRDRLVRLRGLTESGASARIAAQAGDGQRRAAADVWLDNDGAVDALLAQVDDLWRGRLAGFEANLRTGGRSRRPDVPTLVAYDPTWPAQAQRLAGRIRRAAGDRAAAVAHIGSTSVAGLVAKDVIDLQVGVRRLADADERNFVQALARQGFPRLETVAADTVLHGEARQWAKRFHGSADPGRVVHVHVREVGSPGWRFALLFRDWLNADPTARADYGSHKRRLAAVSATTPEYAQAKEPWFALARPRAQEWARRTGWDLGE